MASKNSLKVHLDHLIRRESLRWVETNIIQQDFPLFGPAQRDHRIRYLDLDDETNVVPFFPLLRKPDFQRETSAWSPEDCLSLLESIVTGLIIPSLIVWKSPDNNFLYILDGAHRLSVVRAWMLDDWGDKSNDYYDRHEYSLEISKAAEEVRALVKARIGNYQDFVTAGKRYMEVSRVGSPSKELSELDYKRGLFYGDMLQGAGFDIQRVGGNYKVAESSFLRINRSGQPLDDWETILIENRDSSFARAVMSIVNGGASRFWPDVAQSTETDMILKEIKDGSQQINRKLFVPPFVTPIKDANVPFMVAPGYFQKHAYLLELLPVVSGMSGTDDDIKSMLSRDTSASSEAVLNNGRKLIVAVLEIFTHLTTDNSSDNKSLSIVPLFYFYSRYARYVRSSLYGFTLWLTTGSEEEIRNRKIVFSAHRGRYEQILFENNIAGAITDRVGSGSRATPVVVEFNERVLRLLDSNPAPITEPSFKSELDKILDDLTVQRTRKSEAKEDRQVGETQKNVINMKKLFEHSIRCEICGGIHNLRYGTQYDHEIPYAQGGMTEIANLRPTHPFCNNSRQVIEDHKNGKRKVLIPAFQMEKFVPESEPYQYSLFDKTVFPT
jgi:hypothetical protein